MSDTKTTSEVIEAEDCRNVLVMSTSL